MLEEELDTLEAKVAQLVARYRAMHEDNLRLRQEILAMETTNKRLSERLADVSTRVESLFNRLPDN